MFDIAAILINYNSSAHTINCIESILAQTNKNLSLQIIITDNCSNIDDFIALQNYVTTLDHPNITLSRSAINTGFGGGNMHGVQLANAKYLAFLNNDILFKNDCLSVMKNTMDQRADIGIAGGQAFKENGEFMISLDHFASPTRELLGRKFLEMTNPKKHPKRKKQYSEPVQVNFVPGSFMFVRATDFYDVGGFDTNIFLYYEETDLCLRLLKNKKPAFLIPTAEFIHLHGASTPRSLGIKKELKISLLYVIRKHYGFFAHKLTIGFFIIKYCCSSLVKPKHWPLFGLLLTGAPISKSLRTTQKMER